METSQIDIPRRRQQRRKTAEAQLEKQLEVGVNEFRAEVIERPFLYLGLAFAGGLLSRTFPVRLIFSVLLRLVSILSGPALLLMGILKIRELGSATRDPAEN
jgi:hypothetical protein